MNIINISTDIRSATVYPGDRETEINTREEKNVDGYSSYLVSDLSMSCHTGTHIDAPKHSFESGAKISEIPLNRFFGRCTVVEVSGILTGKDMEMLLPLCRKKVLFHGNGNAFLSLSAVNVLKDYGVDLIGTDADTIGVDFEEYRVHFELARADIIVIEGLDLSKTKSKDYTLSAFPLYISDAEAAPCRAVLFEKFDYWE